MGSYAYQVDPEDRWKVVLYIRKLQEDARVAAIQAAQAAALILAAEVSASILDNPVYGDSQLVGAFPDFWIENEPVPDPELETLPEQPTDDTAADEVESQ